MAKPLHTLRFARRLGPHHFAHLRAAAEGLDLVGSARRYLGIEHGNEAQAAHRQVVDQVRTIGRRQGDPAWRLVGVLIKSRSGAERPSLEDFICERGLDGWSESEQQALYQDAYPVDNKAARREQLRKRQLDLLRRLESTDAEQPKPTDMVTGWFDERTANKLVGAGFMNLSELTQAIARAGRWYSTLPAIGKGKAQRIASHLHTLIPAATAPAKRIFALPSPTPLSQPDDVMNALAGVPSFDIDPVTGTGTPQLFANTAVPGSMLTATTDLEAVQSWIQTHAGSAATVKSFWREARVFMLWLQRERHNMAFRDVRVEDCLAFRAFTENIPQTWISRERASPGKPGWAPFRGQLSQISQHHLLNIVSALFAYLKLANHIPNNPWPLIKTRTAMKKTAVNSVDTRAMSEDAQNEIERFIEAQPPSPARERMLFLVRFLAGVGLRSSEILVARLGDLRFASGGYVLQVIGKGGKPRVAAIPPVAMAALLNYLSARGLPGIEQAPADAPLLANLKDPMEPIGYQALYLTVRAWLRKAISASALTSAERQSLAGASSHWLRHTFATRAIERAVPMEVVQAQLGHANLSTTMNIYAKAPLQRQVAEIGKAFG
jgi:integrase